uniref:Plectin/eS10 N-terminal domain-containing protein n=1 Tax=Phaeocystis antarctica TaxID=33657 RepID=A0A7S0HMZ6_9EUKA
MLISKKNRLAILSYLFKEGVVCAKKDFNLPKHPEIEASNLEVIKLMTSLTSRDLVSSRFSWNYYYWFLTDEGIEYLREYLHLPADTVPNTLKKSTKPAAPPPRPGAEGPDGRPPRAPRPEGGREGGYRGGEGGGAPRAFGRGGGAPRPAGP